MGKSNPPFEIDTSVARWRRIWFYHRLTNDDFFDCMDRFRSRYPDAIYFDTKAMRQIEDIWWESGPVMTLAEMTAGKDAPPIYRSIKDCIAAVPVRGSAEFRNRDQDMTARAPWPVEVAAGTPGILTGSRALPTNFAAGRNVDAWRAYGRCMDIRWRMDYPDFVPAIKSEWHLDESHCGEIISDLEDCLTAYPNASRSHFHVEYCTNDPEMRAFVSVVRSLPLGLMTKGDVGLYECRTGRYLCAYPNREKRAFSKRFLKTLALTPGAYESFWPSGFILKYSDDPALHAYKADPERMLGVGPSPRMKAEAFLEAGRSIDDIDGSDQTTRDAELRRYEKRLKDAGKAAGGSSKWG